MFGSTRQPTESEVKKHHQELNSRLAENGRFDAKNNLVEITVAERQDNLVLQKTRVHKY